MDHGILDQRMSESGLITVQFVRDFVAILGSQPIRTRTSSDIVKTVRDKVDVEFAFSDEDMKKLNYDFVYCSVYAFVRDNKELFL